MKSYKHYYRIEVERGETTHVSPWNSSPNPWDGCWLAARYALPGTTKKSRLTVRVDELEVHEDHRRFYAWLPSKGGVYVKVYPLLDKMPPRNLGVPVDFLDPEDASQLPAMED